MSSSLKVRVAIGLALVFLAGLATGVFAGAWHAHHAFADRHEGRMAEHMRDRLKHELNLTPDQLAKMEPILDQTAKRLQDIRIESGRRVSETLTDAHHQLSEFLNPEQKKQLQGMEQHHPHGMHFRIGHPGPEPREDDRP